MTTEEMYALAQSVARQVADPSAGLVCIVVLCDLGTQELVSAASVPNVAVFDAMVALLQSEPRERRISSLSEAPGQS